MNVLTPVKQIRLIQCTSRRSPKLWKCYCLYAEKMGAGIWKPAGNFLVQRKRGPGIWMTASDSKVISLW